MGEAVEDLISIIVPVYKVEPFLNRCVSSLVEQTYRTLEIILVDDGSPDQCGQICDQWAEKDGRIQVIHKENGGLSDARNAGLKAASGEYIGFVDSDDWIDTVMYERLYKVMQKNRCNIAACGVLLVDEAGRRLADKAEDNAPCICLHGEQAMQSVLDEKRIAPTVWNKLYRSNCIKDIPFAVGKTHEDVFWTYQAVHAAQSVVIISDQLYFYVQRNNSIMNSDFSLRRLDAIEGKQIRLDFIKKYYPLLAGKAKKDLLFFSLYLAQQSYSSKDREIQNEVHTYVKNVMKESNIHLNEISDFRLLDLVWILSARFSLRLTCRIRNWLNIGT